MSWNLTDELAHALAHALAHNHHAKGTCDECDKGRAAVDEWLRLRERQERQERTCPACEGRGHVDTRSHLYQTARSLEAKVKS